MGPIQMIKQASEPNGIFQKMAPRNWIPDTTIKLTAFMLLATNGPSLLRSLAVHNHHQMGMGRAMGEWVDRGCVGRPPDDFPIPQHDHRRISS